jgi:hypothetical protein
MCLFVFREKGGAPWSLVLSLLSSDIRWHETTARCRGMAAQRLHYSPAQPYFQPKENSMKYEGQSKSSRNSFTFTFWCTIVSYRLARVLPVICTCKFCAGCTMQLGGSCTTGSRDSGFCTTLRHRATRLLCSNSCHHPTTVLSGCCSKGLVMVKGTRFVTMRKHRIECYGRTFEDYRTKPSAGASNKGRIDAANVCARKGPTLKVMS